jgi:3-hydroxyisobutyrate dehydrogenase
MTIALCGCGNMGAAIAARLQTAGAELVVFDLDRARAQATGARVADSLSELATRASTVFLSLPTAAASRAVVAELSRALPQGAAVVELSTVAPADAVAAHDRLAARGIRFVDAAVLSGPMQMCDGSTTLLVGGDDADLEATQPALELLGGERIRIGRVGSGMAAKVAHNAVSHAVMVVLLEATSLAASAGVDVETFAELLSRSDAALLRPLQHRLRERVFDERYGGGMPMEAALKDSRLALELAQERGVPLFAIHAAHTPYELAVAEGLGREDYAALARMWERWTGKALRPAAE